MSNHIYYALQQLNNY